MSRERLEQFFQNSSFINAQQATEIAACFSPLVIEKNAFFLREGKVSDAYLFLETGYMRAFVYNTDGYDVTTGFATRGHVVFEVASFFNRTPALENIQALTDCTGWEICYSQLNALFHTRPEFREFGRAMLVQGYANLKSRMLAMITTTAAERYDQLVHTTPELLQHAPLKTVASYLGVTDSSLSRIRKECVGR